LDDGFIPLNEFSRRALATFDEIFPRSIFDPGIVSCRHTSPLRVSTSIGEPGRSVGSSSPPTCFTLIRLRFGYDVSTLSGRLRGDGATGGAYADTYFGKDNAATPLPTGLIMGGTSARRTGGVATDTGARLTAGAEIGGLAANFTSFSMRVRGSLPF
jgi:hypothetical protein